MHPYASDTSQRKNVTGLLVFTSIVTAIGVNHVVSNYIDVGDYAWLISPPTVIGVYGLLWWIFDTWVWRVVASHIPGAIEVPDLNGIWRGTLKSSHHDFQKDIPVTVEIKQSWSAICILLRTADSSSRSVTASILTKEGSTCKVSYDYINEPRGAAIDSLQMHRGTAHLELHGEDELEGQYYSNRGRKNHGELFLRREEKNLS